MKKCFVWIVCVSFLFSFSARKEKKLTPSGTVRITETFFADRTEVTNFSWLEYELWVKAKYGPRSEEHLKVIPDTTVWNNMGYSNLYYAAAYYRHPTFRNHPVVGISYDQVLDYCKWRTERVKEYFSRAGKKELIFEYRLPTKEEWELLGGTGAEVFEAKNEVRWLEHSADNETYIVDYRTRCFINDSVSATLFTSPVNTYNKNSYGLYDIIGNVSEMVAEKGISKGGSWKHYLEECRPGKDIVYAGPESWLGFRCVCSVGK
jgi:formylglycine-generating enzyme required for sulfatase activity